MLQLVSEDILGKWEQDSKHTALGQNAEEIKKTHSALSKKQPGNVKTAARRSFVSLRKWEGRCLRCCGC